jgi:hypothetical protein
VACAARVTFLVLMLVSVGLRAHKSFRVLLVGTAVEFVILLVRGSRGNARDFRAARALARDRAAGIVHVVRTRAAPGADLSPAVEFLPVSRFMWTQAGEAATWRKTGVGPIREA